MQLKFIIQCARVCLPIATFEFKFHTHFIFHHILGNLTPPDSPTGVIGSEQPYSGDLHSTFEYYGIKSSADSPRPLIYFVAIVDILTRYGMRKRTAQTYKSVKHGTGAEISTVKPELYGRRLLDFMSQCIE
ncbi:hypothetical protein PHET_12286 [Paragonimus heterotremus]|uniref:PIPK domain-containing protein n=1 Tax=Paragonimus heterotremus TaxID=100268 RepID=A0A8J4WD92_9TREM|nr:hypothetical protein PHET_12286 [Paragonimus heterotremus]